jgi:hypothetical protein
MAVEALMFNFTNPMWQFLIGPLGLFMLGYGARSLVDRAAFV